MEGNPAEIFCIPSSIDNDRTMRSEDAVKLATALEEMLSYDWETFGQLHLNLTRGTIENLREGNTRPRKILHMIQAWIEQLGEAATIYKVHTILDEAKLVGIKHRFWSRYEDSRRFEEKFQLLHRFFKCLVNCQISEEEWTRLLLKLDVEKKEDYFNKLNLHNKIRQRLDILQYWVEKNGYEEATVDKLKDSLKQSRLRRVLCQISGSEGNAAKMNERFIHFLEDEWDHIFNTITPEQKEHILVALNTRNGSAMNVDDAFDKVMREGNEGFQSFMKIMIEQCGDDFGSLLSNPSYAKLLDIKKIYPKASHFIPTKAYKEMQENLKKHRLVELHGLPGSGKSQCAAAFAKEFITDHPVSLVWFLECKDEERVDDSVMSLRKKLLEAGICTNNIPRSNVVNALIKDMLSSDFYVLLVLEDLYEKIAPQSKLSILVRGLEKNKKVYMIATGRSGGSISSDRFYRQKVIGFTEEEARIYLSASKSFAKNDEKAVEEVAARYSHLPLGIAPAKAYCEENSLSFTEYLQVMDEEIEGMKMIENYQDKWIQEFYKTEADTDTGKNILATMILAISSLRNTTLSGRTIEFQDIFSYAMYFHHEKIPIFLFKQLILQPNIVVDTGSAPVSDLFCKMAINNMLQQLKASSLAVVDRSATNPDSGTLSTHRVVLFALKCIAKRNGQRTTPSLVNALHALASYFQKDNRLTHQHDQLLSLVPHVVAALSVVESTLKDGKNVDETAALLEKLLVIRLRELKGFACTQSDAIAEAGEPLRKAHDELLELICNAGGINVQNLEATVQERVLEGNGPDTYISTKARLLTQFCNKAVDKIPPKFFDRLAQTVILNQEDVRLLKRQDGCKSLGKDIVENIPLKTAALQKLRSFNLALTQEKMKQVYLPEQLASILYTRGRLMFYSGFSGNEETYTNYLKLAHYITKEVVKDTGIRILHLLISDTNALLYLKLRGENKSGQEKEVVYQEAYRRYRKYLNDSQLYYEHGILKEDGKTSYNQMRCYRQMIKSNHEQIKLPGSTKTDDRFEVCDQLLKLVHDHPEYAKTAVDSLLVAGDFCIYGEKYLKAIDLYREVMDRVNDSEDKYQKPFFTSTEGFCEAALRFHNQSPSDTSRDHLEEAMQRCEKAKVLVPRTATETNEKFDQIMNQLEEILAGNLPKRRKCQQLM